MIATPPVRPSRVAPRRPPVHAVLRLRLTANDAAPRRPRLLDATRPLLDVVLRASDVAPHRLLHVQ